MTKFKLRILGLLLAVCVLLSGCSGEFFQWFSEHCREILAQLPAADDAVLSFADMTYTRPDPSLLQTSLDAACLAAEGSDADAALDAVFDFYTVYDDFETAYSLAYIHYSIDMTDAYWQEEYSFCAEKYPLLSTSLEELYDKLADSSLRTELEDLYFGEDFFVPYDGETLWDDAMLALQEQEAALVEQYYTLTEEAGQITHYSESYFSKYFQPLTQLLIELVTVRQQIAQQAGYRSFADFAFEYYHMRSYSPAQAKEYLESIGASMTDLYRQLPMADYWNSLGGYCSSAETFRYVQQAADAMGGDISDAFQLLQERNLYHIEYGKNKAPTSFETYLWSYGVPFVFTNPYMDQSDKLTFAHEFGHFVNEYVCDGSYAGTDVAEIHSQGMEYLSLCYTEESDTLAQFKLAESLCLYVEQSAYALFELELYEMPQEMLTVENVAALYEQICTDFGFTYYDPRDLIMMPHYYIEPMYITSYVVSNDLAMQIYQMELEDEGAGLALYEQCLYSGDGDIGTFVETYDLINPLNQQRIQDVTDFFKSRLSLS